MTKIVQFSLLFIFFLTAVLLAIFRIDIYKLPTNSPVSKSINTNEAVDQNSQSNLNSNDNLLSKLQIPILMYHYIRVLTDQNDKIGQGLSVTPDIFKNQLNQIKALGYTPINFNNLENGNIPNKPIILTFDDGYQDFFDNAFPRLKSIDATATIYIIANRLNGDYLTKEEIKNLSGQGIEVGSHTLNHPDLTTISAKQATSEINDSKTIIENITGKPVISFCYPSGKYSASTVEAVKSAGYKYATTTKSGLANFSNQYELKRYRVTNETDLIKILK